ncbi:MAG TPA: DUF2855 family protein [Xanthobacteraceae bacterium]|nr:DUF2855 family protein [Xanthobacteraceae bacterium]
MAVATGDPRQIDFIVRRDDLPEGKFISAPAPRASELPADCALLKVERFAFTANNITYAMLGDALQYWKLFPAPEGFGNIPVWGFGEVIASRHEPLAEGERLFGYFPMSTHLVIVPANVSKRRLADAAPHRQGVAPVYNQYARVTGDPAYAGKEGDYQALLRPVFMLSFLVDDFLAEAGFFGARAVLISSASSKAAIGLAHLLHENRKPIEVIGLTSPGNRKFVEGLGCYDRVVGYEDVPSLDAGEPVVFVDLAGNPDLRRALHAHYRDNMKYSSRAGFTHRGEEDVEVLPGAKPEPFFAPGQIKKRAQDWGRGGIETRFSAVWSGYAALLDRALKIEYGRGEAAVEAVYRAMLNGRVAPERAHILSLWG